MGYQRSAAAVKNGGGKSEKSGYFDAMFREALAGLSKVVVKAGGVGSRAEGLMAYKTEVRIAVSLTIRARCLTFCHASCWVS